MNNTQHFLLINESSVAVIYLSFSLLFFLLSYLSSKKLSVLLLIVIKKEKKKKSNQLQFSVNLYS